MSVILIVADSLRYDALGCNRGSSGQVLGQRSPFGFPLSPATPTVDRLAAEGVVFDRVISAAPWTVPSLASMLTGLYAHRLGLVQWEQPWPTDAVSLFEQASRAGYEVGSFVFDPQYLFCQVPEARVCGSSQDTPALLQWLNEHRRKPFFLLVHYWWTHIPYIDQPMSTATWRMATDQVLRALRAGPEARAGVQRLYAHAVERFSEVWLPRVLAAADLERCWVGITADHGESWGERTPESPPTDVFDLHGNGLHEEVLRVPLILRPPGGGPGRRVSELVRTVDLAPTVGGLLGFPQITRGGTEYEIDGHDLSAAVHGKGAVPSLTAVSARNHDYLNQSELPDTPAELYGAIALTTQRWRQIWEPRTSRRAVFDLSQDPGETQDLSAIPDEGVQLGWQELETEFRRARVQGSSVHDQAQVQDRLRQWGYLE